MQYELMNLFAVPVYKASLGRDFSADEQQYFREQLQQPIKAIDNHSSPNKYVLDAPQLASLRKLAEEHLQHYFDTIYNTANDVELVITQSWLSMTGKGGAHHTHSHPNSFASGVIYINLAPQDGINFYRNEDQHWFDLQPKQQNYYNAYSYHIETRVGDIVIFPSHIKHGVRPVEADVQRVSLAFNSFLSGELGRDEFSNRLHISVGR
ncbi:MAG: TIGR02466 family protein [Pseudohongiellaceae bacterium]|jgi:uncharacterized protein (TIGR02466 family)